MKKISNALFYALHRQNSREAHEGLGFHNNSPSEEWTEDQREGTPAGTCIVRDIVQAKGFISPEDGSGCDS